MLAERDRLSAEISSIQSQLKNLPQGKLICAKSRNNVKWYLSDGHTQIYLPKRNRKLAEQLALKKYLSALEKNYLQERTAIDFYLRHHPSIESIENKFLSPSSSYHELLSPYFKPLSQELIDWQNASFDSNPKYPEQLIHQTINGIHVRSKSEYMIATHLELKKIPFRYECLLEINSHSFYPDFTIRHPQTGETFYWEHFGLMDDPQYCRNTFSKLQFFASNGILPSINLITTYETSKKPLTSETILQQINNYLS